MFRPTLKTLKAFGILAVAGVVLTGVAMGSVSRASADSAGVPIAGGQAQFQAPLLAPTPPPAPPCAPGYIPNTDGPGCHPAQPPCAPGYVPNNDGGQGCHPAQPLCAPGYVPNDDGHGCHQAQPPCAPGYVPNDFAPGCHPAQPPCPNGDIPNADGQGCHQAGPPPAPTSGPIDCSSIVIENQQPTSPAPVDSATCFYTAYQTCTPANLSIQFSPVGAGGQHSLSLVSTSAGCSVADALTPTTDGAPSGATTNISCASLQLSATQLTVSSCAGAPPIIVPL